MINERRLAGKTKSQKGKVVTRARYDKGKGWGEKVCSAEGCLEARDREKTTVNKY